MSCCSPAIRQPADGGRPRVSVDPCRGAPLIAELIAARLAGWKLPAKPGCTRAGSGRDSGRGLVLVLSTGRDQIWGGSPQFRGTRGGPMSIRPRSDRDHGRCWCRFRCRHAVAARFGVLADGGSRWRGGTACRLRPSRPHTSAVRQSVAPPFHVAGMVPANRDHRPRARSCCAVSGPGWVARRAGAPSVRAGWR